MKTSHEYFVEFQKQLGSYDDAGRAPRKENRAVPDPLLFTSHIY